MSRPLEFRAIEPFRSAIADRYRLNRELGHGGMDGTVEGRISPDGRFVVAQMLGASSRIFPVDGGPARDLPSITSTDHMLRWSPDGRFVWVQGASNLGTHIDQVDAATGRRSPLVVIKPMSRSGLLEIDLPTVADDPRVYAYVLMIHESRTFVVDGVR